VPTGRRAPAEATAPGAARRATVPGAPGGTVPSVHIVAALFVDDIGVRQVPGPSTRIDLGGVHFSAAAPSPAPVTVAPHLVVLVHCPPGDQPNAALEVVYRRAGEQVARNVQPLQVEPGKFNYRLVRAELEFEDYGTVEAHCRIDMGDAVVVPFTLLPPAA
jgi:hypothetical protein